MDPKVQVELVKQLGGLLQTAIVIAVAYVFLVRFRAELGGFVSRLSQLTLKTPAGEISATAVAEAGALLSVAQTSKEDGVAATSEEKSAAVAAVGETVKAAAAVSDRLKSRTLLWVDDNPKNNRFEIQTLEKLGIRVDTALSTKDGLQKLLLGHYDVAVTDLTRGSDTKAGLKFIEEARAAQPALKIVVYSSRRGEPQYESALRLGAVGATFLPTKLVNLVVEALA